MTTESSRSITLADGRILVWDEWGDPAGTPLLYVHGTPGSGREAQVLHHAAGFLGIRIIAPHRPGYGGSTHLPGRSVLEWSEDAYTLLDELGLPAVMVLGFSGGGPHAIAFALRYPSRVSAVGLVASAGSPSGFSALLSRGAWTVGMPVLAGLLGLPRLGRRLIARSGRRRRSMRAATIFSASLDTALGQGREQLRGAVRDSWAIYGPWSRFLNWNQKGIPPFLLWHGADDTTVKPEVSHRISRALAGSKLTILPDVGHVNALSDHGAGILCELKRAAESRP